jgi:hypothetical protein
VQREPLVGDERIENGIELGHVPGPIIGDPAETGIVEAEGEIDPVSVDDLY